MRRLVLVDGNAILHRAYHALPALTTPDGKPVNAVYGFVSMLLKLFNDLKPTHLVVAFDRPAPTFREKLYKEYQATRPKMEEDLSSQVDLVHQVIAAFGIPIYEVDGFEADDVIATVVAQVIRDTKNVIRKAKKASDLSRVTYHVSPIDQIIIVTGDRDLLQLVDENTFLYMPTKGLSEAKLYDEPAVKEKLGVAPSQIADFKALAGDASDNYPGVPGIGPKTAAELLNQFGSMEGLYKAGKKLPETLRAKLKEGQDSAELGKQLATVRSDAPVEFDLEKSRLTTLDTPNARRVLEELHFQSLLKRLSGSGEVPKKKERPLTKVKEENKREGEQQQLF